MTDEHDEYKADLKADLLPRQPVKGWLLVRVAAPAALWIGERIWGRHSAWWIVLNKPLPWVLRWLGKREAGGEIHRLWWFQDAERELRVLFHGRLVDLMWRNSCEDQSNPV